MISLFDLLRKKLPFFPGIVSITSSSRKFDGRYCVFFLVICVLFCGNVRGELGLEQDKQPGQGRQQQQQLPPLLFLGGGGGLEKEESFQKTPKSPQSGVGGGERNGVPEYIRGSLSSLCEKCSEAQREKVEQILLLLFNFNSQGEEKDDGKTDDDRNKHGKFSSNSSIIPQQRGGSSSASPPNDKSKYRKRNKVKKTVSSSLPLHGKKTFPGESFPKFKVTSVPKSSPLIPTPEFQYNHHNHHLHNHYGFGGDDNDGGGGGVIQFPTLSTTPSSSSSSYSAVAPAAAAGAGTFSIFPYYFPSTESSSFRARPTLAYPASFSVISTTMSSALDPAQSVEMPTPPMPPTTTGPIYLYYVSSSSSSSGGSSGHTATVSSSIQPPTTPVVESSVASKPTTIEP